MANIFDIARLNTDVAGITKLSNQWSLHYLLPLEHRLYASEVNAPAYHTNNVPSRGTIGWLKLSSGHAQYQIIPLNWRKSSQCLYLIVCLSSGTIFSNYKNPNILCMVND